MLAIIERQIELLQERLADTEIRAPFAGIIVSKATEVGEWVGEGDAIAEVLEIDAVEAWINVPQGQYQALAADAAGLQVMIDATGAVETPQSVRILPQVDQTARTFTVIVRLANENGRFAPGMSITAWTPTDVRGEHLTVSKNAVLRNDSGEFAYVVRDGVAMPARLRVLFPASDRYVVQSAELAAGDQVVVEGNERLFPTAPVSVIED
jgi:membrane fusion protein (multidrug efflux system)